MLGEPRGRWMGGCLLTAFFAAVLVAGAMSSGITIAGAGPSGTIIVRSDPSGATVKVDDVERGVTPLKVLNLTPGAHRVSVAKAGYLENTRVVQVTSGRTLNVDVLLTSTSLPGQEPTTATQRKKGGSRLQWLLPIAGGGAVGAVLLARSMSNSAPVVSGVTVSPSIGLVSIQTFSFIATASDPNGDALSYSWNFGDNTTSTQPGPRHVYHTVGLFTVTVTVSDGKASVSATGTANARDLSGTWHGSIENGPGTDFNLPTAHVATTVPCGNWLTWNLTQSGTSISGSHYDTTNGNRTITSGSIYSLSPYPYPYPPFQVMVTLNTGPVYEGTVNSSFNEISGFVTGYGPGGVTQAFTVCR